MSISNYTRINWENEPSINTPIDESNLNAMDYALFQLDQLSATRADLFTSVKDVSIDETTGVITITWMNGTTRSYDTALEKIATNFSYDSTNQRLVLTMPDGSTEYVDLSALITQYEFTNTDTIVFSVGADGKVSASIPDGSITGDKLQPNYLADITAQAQSADTSATNASTSETNAYNYAQEAKGYRDQAQSIVGITIATTSQAGLVKIPTDGTITIDADGTIHGAGGTIDDEMSLISTNAVQNRIVTGAVNGKADNLVYDEDNSLLYLKSGNVVLSSVEISGGGASTIIHVDTHEESWKGNQNVLVEIFDDTADYQGHFDSNGDYFHKVRFTGKHIVKVTDAYGNVFQSSVNVTSLGAVYYIFIDETQHWKEWVNAGGLTASSYASLEAVLADEKAIRRLMTIHASVDYLCEWYETDNSILSTFVASATAMKWIGLRDYACDKLLAIAEWETAMLGSENWEYILKDKVPTMTSDSAPYGTVLKSSEGGGNSSRVAWRAFDGDDSTQWQSTNSSSQYIEYKFTNPISVRRIGAKLPSASQTYTLKYSDDGVNYTDTGTFTLPSSIYSLNNVSECGYHLYWRMTANFTGYAGFNRLQFYGRTLSVSVPTMTSNTAPWGECIYSTEVPTSQDSNAGRAYLAFNNVLTSDLTNFWMSSATQANQYVGYKFEKPIVCKKFAIYPFYWSNSKSSVEISVNASNDGNAWTELLHRTITQSNAYQYYDLENNTEYQYYMCKYVTTSQTDNYTICREIQFYGTDYSEREFASGSTMKYLYDHGCELETLDVQPYSPNNTIDTQYGGDSIRITSKNTDSWPAVFANVTISGKNLLRVILGADNASNYSNGLHIATSIQSTTANSALRFISLPCNPNEPYLDVSSCTTHTRTYIGIYARNESTEQRMTVTEWWLE